MIIRSILGKLWLSMVVLVILVMFLLGFFLSQFFENFYFMVKSQELAKNGAKIAEMIAASPNNPMRWEAEVYNISKYIDAKIVITDKAGLIRVNTINNTSMDKGTKLEYPDVEKILQGEVVAQRGTYPGINATVLSVGVPIKIGHEVVGAVFLHSPVEPVSQTVRTVQKTILLLAIGTIFLATILGFIFSKTITRPIMDMIRVAMEMAKGNFSEKVTAETDDELGLLGDTLNFLSSELQKNMDALSNEKDQLANILTSMTDAVITLDISGKILLMNPPAQKLLQDPVMAEQKPGNYPGLSVLKEKANQALLMSDYSKCDITIGDRIYNLSMAPFRHGRGGVRGIVAVLHDITKEKRLDSLRREFVANVSHELRSPLSLLQGYVEALTDGLAEDEEQREKYLNIVLDETLRLRRLVNDILDLSQLETGNINMKTEPVVIQDLVLRVTERFVPLFAEQHKTLQVSVPENIPMINGDEDKLQQVLINLLDNSVRHTPEHGVVRVAAELKGEYVEISVADSGEGIQPGELAHVWERFYKVDKARTREGNSGTGLGLAIAKNIVLAHHGQVGVTSEYGKGARFTFSIPVGRVESEEVRHA
ncbi:MAG: ATP-binding protein [Thermincola sp.]|jgi:two-component system sensor histidine kinase ResE|nr:ATP-binding protein [Thermincola sp.]MDT3703906.1 ATP-binding protein [Thermincola sp.]